VDFYAIAHVVPGGCSFVARTLDELRAIVKTDAPRTPPADPGTCVEVAQRLNRPQQTTCYAVQRVRV
jgi:hypothetical protein